MERRDVKCQVELSTMVGVVARLQVPSVSCHAEDGSRRHSFLRGLSIWSRCTSSIGTDASEASQHAAKQNLSPGFKAAWGFFAEGAMGKNNNDFRAWVRVAGPEMPVTCHIPPAALQAECRAFG